MFMTEDAWWDLNIKDKKKTRDFILVREKMIKLFERWWWSKDKNFNLIKFEIYF
jgi:hypothetical protein